MGGGRWVVGKGGGNGGTYSLTVGQYGLFAVAGNVNTGGGGGGGTQINGTPFNRTYGANGGSGVCIFRLYSNISSQPSTTGATISTLSDGYTYYTFNTSGTLTF